MIPALVVAAAVGATAAPPPKELRFGHITVREGLSNSWVHAILKDQRGFMWFGTSGGLDRYDGSEFVHYEPRPGDATSLGSRAVMALVEDRQGRLWVGGANGLSLYDRALDRFTTYAVSAQGMDNDVRDVLEDDEGRVWVVTVAGRLHQFDPAAGSFRAFGEARGRTEWPCLFEDRTGHLWVGSAAGLDRCDRGRRACVSVAGLRGSEVTDVLQDADGTLWVGTLGAGLNRLDPETLGVERYLPDPKDPASIASRRVRKLGRDDDGRLYLGTENGGLDVFDPRAQTFVHHVFDREDPGSIGNNSVWDILFDDRGILWTGTYGDGVSFATPQRQRFTHLKARRGGLSDSRVSAILEDHRGDLWIGTDGGGLHRLERSTGRFTYYRHDPADSSSLPSDAVWALMEDSRRRLWVGTWAGGLCRLEADARRFECHRHDPADAGSIAEDNVWRVLEDGSGELIVGLNDSGPDVFDPASKRFSRVSSRFPALQAPSSPAIALDRSGGLWVGGYRGAEYLDRKTGEVTAYPNDPHHDRTIGSGFVQDIYVDSRDAVWLAMEDGLTRIDAGSGAIQRLTMADGLAHHTVNSILEDQRGNLWLGTLGGVSKLEDAVRAVSRPRFVNFHSEDGVQDLEFFKRSAFRSPAGELLFGGQRGLNAFFPEALRPNAHPPPVVLTGLELFNRPVVPGGPGSPLSRAIGETQELTLSYRQSVVSFRFAALDYVAPSRNRLAYKLEGFDADWTEGLAHRATYTNLPAGRYVFRVRGSNNDGVWNDQGVSLVVRVTPPFWKARWFVIACVLAAALAVAAGHRLRVRQLTAREREVARRVEESLAADIRVLRGLLPVCAWCKKIRDDKGYWSQMEVYIREHSRADFSHGICPDCAGKIRTRPGSGEETSPH